ncbi:tRNA pseudouridine(55) synthase TruB [Mycetocola spongiae]|uniref:tRNA pseudouridine(55) synthase TruB n=1 Tax=Mycetocola spongiae TaxID=2859226 RepID=UPI001CF171E0|nr:tRNA pseudouridine(55) synthase TruB [Mycetocola spongiae]UCR90105.1 tRNA pseudouridine(55) synthase TruB [Mycetocola spongiae]
MSSGIVLVDKPGGMTSHDVVARTRRLAGTRKVGHAGTLDPMATGLLILGLNSATRLLTYVVGLDKEYTATIVLGADTTTDDAEGETLTVASPAAISAVTEAAIAAGITALSGDILQVPSSVSAIKVNGERAYARVRAGETVELKSRPVTISAFEVLETRRGEDRIELDVRVECSTGTYIRALARDLGAGLGVGGHLSALRRTRIGPFMVGDAASLEDLAPAQQLIASASAAAMLFPTVTLDAQRAVDLGHGKRIGLEGFPETSGPIAALAPGGRLIGLVSAGSTTARCIVNFPTDAAAEDSPEGPAQS